MSTTIKASGIKEVANALVGIEDKVARKASRRAVGKGATQISREMKKQVPKESKALSKSIGKRIKQVGGTRQNNIGMPKGTRRRGKVGGTYIAIVGPRRGYSAIFKDKRRVPTHYDHLVHNGHINADGSFTPGNPFIDRTYQAAGPKASQAVTASLKADLS